MDLQQQRSDMDKIPGLMLVSAPNVAHWSFYRSEDSCCLVLPPLIVSSPSPPNCIFAGSKGRSRSRTCGPTSWEALTNVKEVECKGRQAASRWLLSFDMTNCGYLVSC